LRINGVEFVVAASLIAICLIEEMISKGKGMEGR